jgi:DNA-binding CsgD family transcriptional regulator
MDYEKKFSYAAILDYLDVCGKSGSPKDLAKNITEKLCMLVPYDQARIYCINTSGSVFDEILFGVDKRWPSAYYDYYSQILNGKYSLLSRTSKNGHHVSSRVKNHIYDWTHSDSDEFVADYIKPQGIRYSFGIGLYDDHNICRKVCMFDRIGRTKFTDAEQEILALITTHLENLHRNFYIVPQGDDDHAIGKFVDNDLLTAKEAEIASLICKGFSPQYIARTLFVSRATVYKHLAHIHTKLGVSNRQELIIKMFGLQDKWENITKMGEG